jgi:hypothetical protein
VNSTLFLFSNISVLILIDSINSLFIRFNMIRIVDKRLRVQNAPMFGNERNYLVKVLVIVLREITKLFFLLWS